MPPAQSTQYRRAGWFTLILMLITIVGDGWFSRTSELLHQLFLLPFLFLFLFATYKLLFATAEPATAFWSPAIAIRTALILEILSALIFIYECRHYANLGYRLHLIAFIAIFGTLSLALGYLATKQNPNATWLFVTSLACYVGGLGLAIASFPLTYLRSDMLPVILWADTNLLHHISPYATMFVDGRVYDFPYLPGMLVAYLPFIAAHLDIRFGSMLYVAATAALICYAARPDRRREVAAVLALFLICPFLQYRQDLYIQPHWFTLALGFVLMQRRRFAWAAVAFGLGMATYQFSWILFPFFALNAYRRRGWLEAAKLTLIAALGALVIVGPFLKSALHRIASNTVGQWEAMPHALAEPMNLSYWLTYLIHPGKLLRVQAVVMIAIFAFCFFRNRCGDLTDTLRWMIVALTLFILLNVMVDGYFYLMLLVPMLIYTCVANGWWREPEPA